MTTTIENGFGSRVMANGFLLNNELTDFSFETHDENGWPIANALAPGKRPRSSMAPTIVLKDDRPVMVIGSPGGSRIIGYVARAIVAHLDWGMDIQQAVAAPNIVNRFGPMDVEPGLPAALAEGLADRLNAAGIPCFGPTQAAAQLETSKAFSKAFLQRHGIPTAGYGVYEDVASAKAALDQYSAPYVIKADGLAAGKGVAISPDRADAEAEVAAIAAEEEGARDALTGAFEELKKFEHVAETTRLNKLTAAAKREAAAYDEMGLRRRG